MALITLASTSVHRRRQLEILGLGADYCAPRCEEVETAGEGPLDRCLRLAREKAESVWEDLAGVVIAADQVACLGHQILNKPATVERARAQLLALSGQRAEFFSALAVGDCQKRTLDVRMELTTVHFRPFNEREAESYLEREPALDSVGAFKSEGLGIALCQRIESCDPTALVGLPLILLGEMLAEVGIQVLVPRNDRRRMGALE